MSVASFPCASCRMLKRERAQPPGLSCFWKWNSPPCCFISQEYFSRVFWRAPDVKTMQTLLAYSAGITFVEREQKQAHHTRALSPGLLRMNDSQGEKHLPGLEICKMNTEQKTKIIHCIFTLGSKILLTWFGQPFLIHLRFSDMDPLNLTCKIKT